MRTFPLKENEPSLEQEKPLTTHYLKVLMKLKDKFH